MGSLTVNDLTNNELSCKYDYVTVQRVELAETFVLEIHWEKYTVVRERTLLCYPLPLSLYIF